MNNSDVVCAVVLTAEKQDGVITRPQALRVGASDKTLGRLVRQRILTRPHTGVYLLAGAPASPLTLVRTGLAAVGGRTAASHHSAAWLMGLIDVHPGWVDVTVSDGLKRQVPGVRVHRSGSVPTRSFQGIRCTDVPRTLVDLAAVATPEQLGLAVDRALSAGRTRVRDLARALGEGPRPGTSRLRDCLLQRGDFGAPEASVLESQMARLLVRHGLPAPRAEVHAGRDGRYRMDYAYTEQRVAVELNGYAWHHSPEQMRRDLARQRDLVLSGWRVLVYSWWDVVYDGPRVVAEIRAALQA